MHTIFEGAAPFVLKAVLEHCARLKVFEIAEIIDRAKVFDYGLLNDRNIPSEIIIDRKTLGQNASQSKCLFQHIPFILYKYRQNNSLMTNEMHNHFVTNY